MQRKLLGLINVDSDKKRSTTDHIFCIRQILEKKWEYNEVVHQLFIDFKKAYDSVRGRSCIMFSLSLGSP